ncbi:hypothetical protein TrLO_g7772 [Triparma laevis f. longispina]|uniref:Glycosyltransferase n=1 Tax=Triparma laevis f. longispina TaxID=1714387 RepID=A0A9W7KTR1_9STRA|nr:hypothetical protein TrLO_g7772 [Triparma laevis f. longispina]
MVEPRLLPYFINEKLGMFKADMCRVAALYLNGGYYLDIDLGVVEPIIFDNPRIKFSTMREAYNEWVHKTMPPGYF